jgi:hypothetical protein
MSITDQGAVDTIMKDIDAIIHIAGLLVNALPSERILPSNVRNCPQS